MNEVPTPMGDIIVMTISECAAYLPRQLSGGEFLKASVADDVVE